jgi:hypothetical protein
MGRVSAHTMRMRMKLLILHQGKINTIFEKDKKISSPEIIIGGRELIKEK